MGGKKKAKWIRTILAVFENTLSWTHKDFYKKVLTAAVVIEWLTDLIKSKYCLISSYGVHLDVDREQKASTIRTKVVMLRRIFKWAVLFRDQTAATVILHPYDLLGIMEVLATVNSGMGRQISIARSEVTRESLIWDGLLPENGLRDIQRAVESAQPWVSDLINMGPIPDIDEQTLTKLLGFMVTSIHVKAATGRSQGLGDLRTHQMKTLLGEGVVLTDKFKTHLKFGYMPIIAADADVKYVLGFFLEHVRPYIASAESLDYLFINSKFTVYLLVHRLLLNF